jgi:hypothetical protein
MIRASLSDLIQKSTRIVRGRVSGTSCESGASGIFTKVKVKVVESWKGPNEPSLEVTIPGGICNGSSQSVAGAPDLDEGQEYVFFLWTGRTKLNHLLGLGQGVLDIGTNDKGEAIVSRSTLDTVMLDGLTGAVVKDQAFSMRLSDFGTQVRRTLGAEK